MRILYPITMALLPGQKYNSEIVALAIMGQAGQALNGQSQYIETTPEMYGNYCALSGHSFWPRLLEIIADGGEVADLEAFFQAPETILDVEVPAGLRYDGRGPGETPRTFRDWNDGNGNNPVFNLLNDDVIFRTNLGGYMITYQELALLADVPGVQLKTQAEVNTIIESNTP